MTKPTRTKTRNRPALPEIKHLALRRGLIQYPEVKGKKLEGVEFSTMSEDHSVTLIFQDNTTLRFAIQPGFTMFTDYADWKTGDQRLIKSWPAVRSRLFRDE